MKKNYVVPATMVQSVDMDNLMAASGGVGLYKSVPQSDDVDNQFSKKHYSVWGDDEE